MSESTTKVKQNLRLAAGQTPIIQDIQANKKAAALETKEDHGFQTIQERKHEIESKQCKEQRNTFQLDSVEGTVRFKVEKLFKYPSKFIHIAGDTIISRPPDDLFFNKDYQFNEDMQELVNKLVLSICNRMSELSLNLDIFDFKNDILNFHLRVAIIQGMHAYNDYQLEREKKLGTTPKIIDLKTSDYLEDEICDVILQPLFFSFYQQTPEGRADQAKEPYAVAKEPDAVIVYVMLHSWQRFMRHCKNKSSIEETLERAEDHVWLTKQWSAFRQRKLRDEQRKELELGSPTL